jgi:hypothetical protein
MYVYGRYSALVKDDDEDEWSSLRFWDGPEHPVPAESTAFVIGEPVFVDTRFSDEITRLIEPDQIWFIGAFFKDHDTGVLYAGVSESRDGHGLKVLATALRKLDPLLRLAVEAAD